MIEHRCFSCQFRVIVFVDPLWFEAFGSRRIVFLHERCRAIYDKFISPFFPRWMTLAVFCWEV